jgi:transmembrane sensor
MKKTAGAVAAIVALAALYVFVLGPLFAKATVHSTAARETTSVTLPDSSEAILGPSSELRVPARFARDRRVDVLGQVWFRTRGDSASPMIIRAAGTTTEAGGATFVVRASVPDSLVTVIVVDGVAVVRLEGAPREQAATVRANDMVDVDARAPRAHITREIAAANLTSWVRDTLSFDNTVMSDVAVELQRWYGVVNRYAVPDLAQRRVTFSIPARSFDDALRTLNATMMMKFERRGDTLFVR